MNYYNEFDPKAAAWLRELIRAGEIPPGEVDERSIVDVRGDDLRDFIQCHFFAGIGGWSLALKLAGWPADRAVYTASCPCQPFSAAGKGLGTADPRHLWPQFARIVRERRPARIYGEQVASAAGRAWLAGVCADLEGMGYAVAGADLCAAGAGAPHIRQRLYWVANALAERHTLGNEPAGTASGRSGSRAEAVRRREPSGLADADGRHAGAQRQQRGGQHGQQPEDRRVNRLADAACGGLGIDGCAPGRAGHAELGGETGVLDQPDRERGTAGLSGSFAGHEGHAGIADDSGDQVRAREREREREKNLPAGARRTAGTGRTHRA